MDQQSFSCLRQLSIFGSFESTSSSREQCIASVHAGRTRTALIALGSDRGRIVFIPQTDQSSQVVVEHLFRGSFRCIHTGPNESLSWPEYDEANLNNASVKAPLDG